MLYLLEEMSIFISFGTENAPKLALYQLHVTLVVVVSLDQMLIVTTALFQL